MHSHWDKHLNVRELLYAKRPKLVVECGAGSGENTANLMRARDDLGFSLVVINDDGAGGPRDEMRNAGVDWRSGISYRELPTLSGVDFCLIDTDHNYWTLRLELDALYPASAPGALCVMHDTVTFAKNNGKMPGGYNVKARYPHDEIEAAERRGLGMIDAINEDCAAGKWRIVRSSIESHGAIAMERL